MIQPTVPGCVRCEREPGHEGVHVPELATEDNGLLPRRRASLTPPLCRCPMVKHPHAPEHWCPS